MEQKENNRQQHRTGPKELGSGGTGNLFETQEPKKTGSPIALSDMAAASSSGTHILSNEECGIRDVWRHNLEDEFKTIRQIVEKYNYIATKTVFLEYVAQPSWDFQNVGKYPYSSLRVNVSLLRIIQLGLTFFDENGNTPDGSYTTWQFNFKFSFTKDLYAQKNIDLLKNSSIQFKKHEEEGIDPLDFVESLMTSSVVRMDNIKWLSFHSCNDFGYLIKLITKQDLPLEQSEFFELLRLYFPTIYDVKYLTVSCLDLVGDLEEVATQLNLARVGHQHEAGSDSLLAGIVFFKIKEMFFKNEIDSKYRGYFYRFDTSYIN